MMPNQLRRSLLPAAVFALAGSVVIACNIPVFRYALERWPADVYEIVVLHDGPLGDGNQTLIDQMREYEQDSALTANLKVRTIDVTDSKDAQWKDLWNEHGGSGPLMAVLYPPNAREVPDRLVRVSPFNEASLQDLARSPLRQELIQRLLNGDSAVWIFVPSGNKDQDALAWKTLNEQVQRNEDQLELPPQDEIEADEFFKAETPIELRLGFSIVTLDRDDPKEQFFLQMLLGSEPDLEELDQPMAFPVIGRGRVLYALVGKGIFQDTIAMASRFVVGPCSCQVKDQNPGFDLLLAVDWDKKLGGSSVSDPPPPKSSKPVLVEIPSGN